MRIVLFNPFYLPIRNPRTLRIRKMIQSVGICHSILLFCSNGISSLDQTESFVVRVGFRIFSKRNLSKSGLFHKLVQFLKKFVWPDVYVFNNLSIVFTYFYKYYKDLDIVITISQPFSTHLIGLLLKLRHPKIKWIVDIGDNYTENPTNSLYRIFKPLMRHYEKRILVKADSIVFNSVELKNYYLFRFNVDVNKISIIPNGSSIDFKSFSSVHSNKLVLSYIGNTYEPVRSGVQEMKLLIDDLVNIGWDLERIEIWLVGNQCNALLNEVETFKFVKIKYCESESDLLTIYQQTNILLNFANLNYPSLPSKLYEYKQSGLPIINFYTEPDDPSINYLANEEHILHSPLSGRGLSVLGSFIKQYQFFHKKQAEIDHSIEAMWLDLIKKTNL